ncbi:anti-sigma factor domain-containing protein [Glutamicibacter mishrai]|uniref:Regulator of SigK n=1 Tax=Glutamicibacter mishrai TaxID=1775880 RepID=A0A6H0SN05_9MICC|nr:anti-sigma factor [Glutamicibacter mishrai]QIV87971.1 anti-sigma factor [Glutamicibacter mishrai]
MDKHKNERTDSFAADALGDKEREQLLNQSPNSDQARQELDALQETAGLLGLAAQPVAPPPRLKANIMSAIRTTEQLPPVEDQEPTLDNSPAAAPATEAPREPGSASEPPVQQAGTGRGTQRFFALAAGVLLLAAVALGGLAINQTSEQRELENKMAAMASHEEELTRILSAPDAKSKTQTLEDGARITLSYSADEGLMAVSTSGMPALSSDKGYELWLISADGAVSAGMLTGPDADGMIMVSDPMKDITHFGITVEPAAGSPAPTTDPIMVQSL